MSVKDLEEDAMSRFKNETSWPIPREKGGFIKEFWMTSRIVERLIEVFPNPVAIINCDGEFLKINEKLAKMFGGNRRDLIGRRITDVVEFVGDTSFTGNFFDILSVEDSEVPLKFHLFLKKRKVKIEAVAYNLTRGNDAKILIVFNASYEKDKTLARLIEERTRDLMKKAEELRSIFEYSPDAIVVTTLDGTIINCNQAMLEMYHFSSKEEVIGKNLIEIISPKDQKRIMEELKHALSEGSVRNVECTFLTEDGYEFPVEFSASVMLNADGTPTLFVIETKDITEHKIMEKQLKQYSEHLEKIIEEKTRQLREAERLAAIGELAAMVGHDLRNPLMGIAGAVYYLKQKLDPIADEKTKEMLGIIKECIEYSNKIVNDLLDYSGDIKLELKETNPRKIIVEALSQINIPNNIKVINSVKARPRIKIDVNKMKRVIINIVKNAIDAMPNGGILKIRSRSINGEWKLSFTDTGAGMPEEIKEKLGKPLFTTKAKGMGLGLAICKRIINAHGGSISVKSSPGKGTTLMISVPLNLRMKRGS